jgi:malate/lactate dehydrogenase
MRFVAILGAGELGASIARALASRGRVAEVRLIDDASDVAAGKALDIQQAAPIEQSSTRVIAAGDLTAAVGAAVVLLADSVASGTSANEAPAAAATSESASQRPRPELGGGAPSPERGAASEWGWGPTSANEAPAAAATSLPRSSSEWGWGPTSANEWSGDAGLALVRRLASIDRQAVIVCAGGNQHAVLTHGLHELHLPRMRFFGSAPEAVVSALRAMVAVEADVSPSVVSLTVLGRIPSQVVVPWSDATVAGRPLSRVLSPAQVARIERRAAAMRTLGPYTLAAAAARLAEMLVGGSRRVVCCTVGLDGEFGLRRVLSAVPVLVAPGGIVRLIAPPLDVREQVLLENVVGS